jgi:hypothetical protein
MRVIIDEFDRQYRSLHERSLAFVGKVPATDLYRRSASDTDLIMKLTVGENILRSAATVELTFGGITTRLWDDPFEWTLPEAISDAKKIVEYLTEVENTRVHGFAYFGSDDDLNRSIPAPRELRPIGALLIETIAKAEHYQGRAFALFQTLTPTKLTPR